MTRRAETIVTLVGAALIALTTLALYLLDMADWPVVLIGIGVGQWQRPRHTHTLSLGQTRHGSEV